MINEPLAPVGLGPSASEATLAGGELAQQLRLSWPARVWRLCQIFFLPIVVYGLFVLTKLTGIDTGVNLSGAHAVMGAAFLLFGASICYLMTVLRHVAPFQSEKRIMSAFWILATALFSLLFLDATFAIHERATLIGLPDYWVFLAYGALLAILVLGYFRTLHFRFFAIIAGFGLLAGAAVIGDAGASHEGIVVLGGREYSYEQAFETFSVLLLAVAFTSEALRDICGPFRRLR